MGDWYWFVKTMKRVFNVGVLRDAVKYDEYEVLQDDLEYLNIPSDHLERLPKHLFFNTFSYVDQDGNDWIAGRVEIQKAILYEVWIKNGEPIAYELYV